MTNAEYFKEQIKELLENSYDLAVVKGRPAACGNTKCEMCDFHAKGCGSSSYAIKWLTSEHLEEKTIKASELADDTKVFVNDSDDFYHTRRRHFAKNLDNKLFAYEDGTTFWTSIGHITCWNYMWLEDGTRVVEGRRTIMDALEFARELKRICGSHKNCLSCELYKEVGVRMCDHVNLEEAVPIVEKWSAEHPLIRNVDWVGLLKEKED